MHDPLTDHAETRKLHDLIGVKSAIGGVAPRFPWLAAAKAEKFSDCAFLTPAGPLFGQKAFQLSSVDERWPTSINCLEPFSLQPMPYGSAVDAAQLGNLVHVVGDQFFDPVSRVGSPPAAILRNQHV